MVTSTMNLLFLMMWEAALGNVPGEVEKSMAGSPKIVTSMSERSSDVTGTFVALSTVVRRLGTA